MDLPELTYQGTQYEYAVLVTSLTDEVRSIAQHYRDRGDAENNFDELKNQWGWAGFTTQDRKRCQIMGRIIALVYNWWTIFMRLGIPDKHAEAITSRPLALHGIARQTRHGNQTTVEITSTHAKAAQIAEILTKVSGFLKRIKTTAEQLAQEERLEADSQRRVSLFPRGQGHWKHWPTRRCPRLTALFRYLLNKRGRSDRFPRRTEIHGFGSLFDQVRQGGHLPGAAYPVADVLKEVHSQFPGCAQQRFHRVPGPGAGQ